MFTALIVKPQLFQYTLKTHRPEPIAELWATDRRMIRARTQPAAPKAQDRHERA